jgi:phosphate starvation-inducible PhoH-like protein
LDITKELTTIELQPEDNLRLANLFGQYNEHLRQIERHLGVEINQRGNRLQIIGPAQAAQAAQRVLEELYTQTVEGQYISKAQVHMALVGSLTSHEDLSVTPVVIQARQVVVRPRTANQLRYVQHILTHDVNFGVGPAGTGKTYLAVACAVAALEQDEVKRIILVRPAVEAGERLGFLPGDMAQKVDPYLRPLYDALYEMLGFERVTKYLERGVIEIAPLAFMRGRTLNDAFIILDESQNTTKEQMKMFLTRTGYGSKVVITGDITQVDIPRAQDSGLRHAVAVLKAVPGISFTFLQSSDVVRHALVQRIVEAYDTALQNHEKSKN